MGIAGTPFAPADSRSLHATWRANAFERWHDTLGLEVGVGFSGANLAYHLSVVDVESLADVRIFRRTLNLTEIQALAKLNPKE